jgi:hypothetical protein
VVATVDVRESEHSASVTLAELGSGAIAESQMNLSHTGEVTTFACFPNFDLEFGSLQINESMMCLLAQLWGGNPAKKMRALDAAMIAHIPKSAQHYVELAHTYTNTYSA